VSKKHRQRSEGRPVTRRYVLRVVQRARDDILSAIVHAERPRVEPVQLRERKSA